MLIDEILKEMSKPLQGNKNENYDSLGFFDYESFMEHHAPVSTVDILNLGKTGIYI